MQACKQLTCSLAHLLTCSLTHLLLTYLTHSDARAHAHRAALAVPLGVCQLQRPHSTGKTWSHNPPLAAPQLVACTSSGRARWSRVSAALPGWPTAHWARSHGLRCSSGPPPKAAHLAHSAAFEPTGLKWSNYFSTTARDRSLATAAPHVRAVVATEPVPTFGSTAKVPPLAVPQLASCVSSGRAWRLWAAPHVQGRGQATR